MVGVIVSRQHRIPQRAGGRRVVDDNGGDGPGVRAGDGVVGVGAARDVEEGAQAGAGAGFGEGAVGVGFAALYYRSRRSVSQ